MGRTAVVNALACRELSTQRAPPATLPEDGPRVAQAAVPVSDGVGDGVGDGGGDGLGDDAVGGALDFVDRRACNDISWVNVQVRLSRHSAMQRRDTVKTRMGDEGSGENERRRAAGDEGKSSSHVSGRPCRLASGCRRWSSAR